MLQKEKEGALRECGNMMKCCNQPPHKETFFWKKGVSISRVWKDQIFQSIIIFATCSMIIFKSYVARLRVRLFSIVALSLSHMYRAALAQINAVLKEESQQKQWEETNKSALPFHATGISLVLHPLNPHIPTIHMNLRYFEVQPQPSTTSPSIWWFGGGIDLTPYYPNIYQVTISSASVLSFCI